MRTTFASVPVLTLPHLPSCVPSPSAVVENIASAKPHPKKSLWGLCDCTQTQSEHRFISEVRETNYRVSQAADTAGVDSVGTGSRCCSTEHGQRKPRCKYRSRTKNQRHQARYRLARAFLFSSAKCKRCVLTSCVCQDLVTKWCFWIMSTFSQHLPLLKTE